MDQILIEHDPVPGKLDVMYVDTWPIWEKEVSSFDWEYDKTETCYILEGEALVTPENGEAVLIQEMDMVTFPAGMKCHWEIRQPIRKHYKLG